MSIKAKLYKETLREIQSINTKNQREYQLQKQKLQNNYPRLEEIEQELNLLGIKTMKLVAFGDANRGDAIATLRTEQQKLIDERENIISNNNIPKEMLSVQYECDICNDTGEYDGTKCSCFKNRVMDKLYNQSNVREMIGKENFNSFKIDYYSDVVDENQGTSPRDNMIKINRRCSSFVENFRKNQGENIILYGDTGLGKTFMCNCIAGKLLEKNISVLYLSAGQMFLKLAEQRFNNNQNSNNHNNGLDMEEFQQWDMEILQADLLIIDDLGTELSNTFTITEFFRILNERKLDNLSTIISTNLSFNELTDLYSDRIMSRIAGDFEMLKFFGDDIRVKKRFM